MSEELLVKEAMRRREIFRNLPKYLRIILETVKLIDEKAEIYLFGSVAEERHIMSSDIDVLIVSSKSPQEIIPKLWERGIGDPFEIHVVSRERLEAYAKRSRLVRVEDLVAS